MRRAALSWMLVFAVFLVTATDVNAGGGKRYPLDRKLSKDELWAMSKKVFPPDLPKYSFGKLAAFSSVIWTNHVFHLAGKTLTEDEFQAMACFCVHNYFQPGGRWNHHPYSIDLTKLNMDRDFEQAVNGRMALYNDIMDFLIKQRKLFDEVKHKVYQQYCDPKEIKEEQHPCTADTLVKELERYRKHGALANNRPELPPEEILPGNKQFVRYALSNYRVKVGEDFKAGDKICNPGSILFWKGTITKVNGDRYQVRIDYHNDLGPIRSKYRRNTEVSLLREEFVRLTRESIRSLIGGRLGR